jgi:hypothetical protein
LAAVSLAFAMAMACGADDQETSVLATGSTSNSSAGTGGGGVGGSSVGGFGTGNAQAFPEDPILRMDRRSRHHHCTTLINLPRAS